MNKHDTDADDLIDGIKSLLPALLETLTTSSVQPSDLSDQIKGWQLMNSWAISTEGKLVAYRRDRSGETSAEYVDVDSWHEPISELLDGSSRGWRAETGYLSLERSDGDAELMMTYALTDAAGGVQMRKAPVLRVLRAAARKLTQRR